MCLYCSQRIWYIDTSFLNKITTMKITINNKNKTVHLICAFIHMFFFFAVLIVFFVAVCLFCQIKGALAFECKENVDYDGMLSFCPFMLQKEQNKTKNQSVSTTLVTCEIAHFFSKRNFAFFVTKVFL